VQQSGSAAVKRDYPCKIFGYSALNSFRTAALMPGLTSSYVGDAPMCHPKCSSEPLALLQRQQQQLRILPHSVQHRLECQLQPLLGTPTTTGTPSSTPRITPTPRFRSTPTVRPTPPPHLTPVPRPPSPRPHPVAAPYLVSSHNTGAASVLAASYSRAATLVISLTTVIKRAMI
jgi:hypothetical protein